MTGIEVKAIIDRTCREFQANLESQNRLPLESFLEQTNFGHLTSENRREIVASLLQLEIEIVRKSGQPINAEDYSRRFPEFSTDFFRDLISLPSIPDPNSGSLLPPRYQLVEKIGAGGLGTVWRAYDKQMKRTMAIKMLHSRRGGDRSANQRLLSEARLTGGLQHPGIPPVYDSGRLLSGGEFFSMKLVEGETLATILKSRARQLPFLIGVFEQIAQTIAYAHAQDVIHRDLKPQNIMVGEFGEVQVMDWGMAKKLSDPPRLDSVPQSITGESSHPVSTVDTAVASQDSLTAETPNSATRQGDILGTPAYMSPEQARGENDSVDQRSDVFALGAMLFEILSQSLLYDDPDVSVVLPRAKNADYGLIEARLQQHEIDSQLIDLCSTCLKLEAGIRPTASQVADRIASYQADVQHRLKQAEIDRNSAMIQSSEQRKRAKVFKWMSAAVLLVSLVGGSAVAWQWNKAVEAAKQANWESEIRRQVNDFFILDMLRLADPDVEPDRDLKLRTVLDRAAESIPLGFKDQPEIEAEIRLQIGRSYGGLGEYQKAKHHFDLAARINQELYGSDSDEYRLVFQQLAKTEHGLGNYQESLDMMERIKTWNSEMFGSNSMPALTAKSAMAASVMMLGDLRKATALQREVVETLETGDDQELLNTHRAKLAHMEFQLSNYDEAESLLLPTLESMEQLASLGGAKPVEADIHYLQALHTVGLIHDARRQFAESESVHRDTLRMYTDLLGPVHPRRLQIANNLAIALLNQNKTQEARELLDDAIPAMERGIGPEHDITLDALNTLAGVYYTIQDYESAEATFLKARHALTNKFESPHQAIITNTNNLGGVCLMTGRYQEAEEWFHMVLEQCEALYGSVHHDTISSLANLAMTCRRLKKFDEAATKYQEAVELARNNLSDKHPDTLEYIRGLALTYEMSDQHEKAEPLLREVIEAYDEQFGREYEITFALKNRLALALLKQGKIKESIPFFEQAYQFQRRTRGETDKKSLSVFWALIRTEEKAGENGSVKARLDRLLEVVDPNAESWLYLRLQSRLGKVLSELGELENAESILLTAFEEQQKDQAVPQENRNAELRKTAGYLVSLYERLNDAANNELWKQRRDSLKPDQK